MSTPAKQHFVPRCYLKEFSDSQSKLFQLKRGSKKVNEASISAICRELNIYTIQLEETKLLNNISDQYCIEKRAFQKQENRYPRLLKKICTQSLTPFSVNRSEVRLFLETIITIKRRNPTVKRLLMELLKAKLNSQQYIDYMSPILNQVSSPEYTKAYLENYRRFLTNKSYDNLNPVTHVLKSHQSQFMRNAHRQVFLQFNNITSTPYRV
jgi:hypothetical protein